MRLGFTGTQDWITVEQFDTLRKQIEKLAPTEAHHGDCVGADSVFHTICIELNIPVIIHPPINSAKQAHCEGAHIVLKEKEYLDRNHDIVDESDHIIATPSTANEIMRSGTWATWRYANKSGKPTTLILPTGSMIFNFTGGPINLKELS